jgi:hypothetical protein
MERHFYVLVMEYLPDEDVHTLRSPANQLLEYWVVTMGGNGTAQGLIWFFMGTSARLL